VVERKKAALRVGNIVLLVLALLTAVEFWVALVSGSAVFLFLIALVKAGVIVQFFMHVYRLWREESH
jgi:heme/copper-type cytochrome/quinol oxidase subunit 4